MEKNATKPYVKGSINLPDQIYKAEIDALDQRRRAVDLQWAPENGPHAAVGEETKPDKKTVGLALSGGGIRSATFSLGVLQALAGAKYLKYVDYLSTVSGGGYIGGSLTWLLSADAGRHKGECVFGTGDETRPDGKIQSVSLRNRQSS